MRIPDKQIRDPRIKMAYNVWTLSARMPSLTGDTVNDTNSPLSKSTPLTGKIRLQFRAAVLTAAKHDFFGGLDFNPLNAGFGRVIRQVNWPREWQLGLKLIF